jgi:hypothetical protein
VGWTRGENLRRGDHRESERAVARACAYIASKRNIKSTRNQKTSASGTKSWGETLRAGEAARTARIFNLLSSNTRKDRCLGDNGMVAVSSTRADPRRGDRHRPRGRSVG